MNSSPIKGIRRKKSLLSEIKVLVVGGPSVGKSGQIFNFPLLFHHVKVVYVRVEWSKTYVITICCWAQSFTWSEEVLKSVCYHPWLLFRIYIIQQQLSQLDCRTHTETRILGTTKAIERELSYTRSLSAATQGSEFTIEHNRVRCSRFGFIHRSTSTFTLLMLNNNKSLCL